MMETADISQQHGKKELPDGWRWVRLREICERLDYGFTASADFTLTEPRFLRITDIQDGNVDWNSVPGCKISPQDLEDNKLVHGDIVFARTGGTTGKSYLIKDPPIAVFASYLIRLRLRREAVDTDYVYGFFQSDGYWRQVRVSARGGAQPNVNATLLGAIQLPIPPLPEQKRIAAILNEQVAAVERARATAEAEMELSASLNESYLRQSLSNGNVRRIPLRDCLNEVSSGVGATWKSYLVMGATRDGIAPAKEAVGKNPERYKLVEPGTIFYNPMRILIGSIAMIDEGEEPGITSPDYVVFKTAKDTLHPRWFYYWLRSSYGQACIKSLARGAVRERMLFRRLVSAEIDVPSWESQVDIAEKLKSVAELRRLVVEQLDTINKLPGVFLRKAFEGAL